MKKAFLIFFLFLTLISSSFAINETLIVSVKSAEPFVIVDENNQISGFSVDLMNLVAKELDTKVIFTVDPDLKTHLDNVRDSKVDLGIATTTITASREEYLDFSHPFYESSLAIMLKEGSNKKNIFVSLVDQSFLSFMGIVVLVILLLAHILWFVERDGKFKKMKYFPGIFTATWWTITALMPTSEVVEYDKLNPTSKLSKILSQAIVIIGIIAFGLVLAKMASVFTLNQLESSINGPEDLMGKDIAVIVNTQSVEVVKDLGVRTIEVTSLDEGVSLLKKKKVDALVYDEPILRYYIKTQGSGDYYLASKTFFPNSYGITMPQDSEIREEVNIALLEVLESVEYNKLEEDWFGE